MSRNEFGDYVDDERVIADPVTRVLVVSGAIRAFDAYGAARPERRLDQHAVVGRPVSHRS